MKLLLRHLCKSHSYVSLSSTVLNNYNSPETEYGSVRYDPMAEAEFARGLDLRMHAQDKERVESWDKQIRIPLIVDDITIGNIVGLPPVPERPTSWQTFLREHWGVIAGADFFTTGLDLARVVFHNSTEVFSGL